MSNRTDTALLPAAFVRTFAKVVTKAPGKLLAIAFSVWVLSWSVLSNAQNVTWPQEIAGEDGTLVIYQPQPESLVGNRLSARAAISIELVGQADPVFGAMWFESRIDTDQDAGTVSVLDIKVTKAAWPSSKDAGVQRLTDFVQTAFPDHGLEISLERLSASLETADIERKSLEDLNNDAPVIRFSQTLSVLLLFDGKPRFDAVENSPYERALNTPFLVAREKNGTNWLSDGTNWYSAGDPLGPWTVTRKPPADLDKAVREGSDTSAGNAPSSGPAPEIVVAIEPTELIVSTGKPDWQSLAGGDILYVQNTETPWLRYLPTGNMYLLLSGRWFRSKTQDGPWTFVRGDELPEAFAEIPPASDIGGLRTSVAGTEEAEQAMLDAAIPQTAAIVRSEASLSVDYDGKPEFKVIDGTAVAYAVNTGAQVLRIDALYYAVDDGVWFTAKAATGPWSVASEVPADEIAKIPPSSPVYNVTHVHVYASTPEVVYVGYTPGYMWSFPYYGVPVYGTGWYYPPYWGRYYYPRPPTWGLHVGYNPWTGWNFGLSWSNGFFTFGMSWGGSYGPYRRHGCCGGFYGGGYRGPVVINTGDINIGNNINIGNRTEISNRIGDNNLNISDRGGDRNLYNRAENRDRLASDAQRDQLKRARPASDRANNVFADRNGNVARRVDNSWETRDKGQWNKPKSSRDLGTSSVNRNQFDRNQFDRASHARNRGASREMRRPTRGRRR